MNVLAYRSQYKVADAGVEVIEWFVATDYGVGHFVIRSRPGSAKPMITTTFQSEQHPFLKRVGLNGVRQNFIYKRVQKKHADSRVPLHNTLAPDIEALENTWHLAKIFASDVKADNSWRALTGRPVGESYESIVAKAQEVVADQRQAVLKVRAVEMAAIDSEWGMF